MNLCASRNCLTLGPLLPLMRNSFRCSRYATNHHEYEHCLTSVAYRRKRSIAPTAPRKSFGQLASVLLACPSSAEKARGREFHSSTIIFTRARSSWTTSQSSLESNVGPSPSPHYVHRANCHTDGDLDPNITRYTLTPLKVVYKKLRLLVDRGCIFIGHGLSKDFRIISKICNSPL